MRVPLTISFRRRLPYAWCERTGSVRCIFGIHKLYNYVTVETVIIIKKNRKGHLQGSILKMGDIQGLWVPFNEIIKFKGFKLTSGGSIIPASTYSCAWGARGM